MRLKIKRLDSFMLQTFLPQFCMTFFICLFILMMQFLFRYIADLVGKGLGLDVLAELFFYAALSMVPMALPLAILLASLMTFGNLGEHVELTAMKSSGTSLLRVMKPLIVFISLISIGAFFFQNDVLPRSQVKMWTLLFSARQKSLSLDISEGAINRQIPGYNVYVKHKDKDTEMLHGLLIYDVSSGSTFPRIVSADSGKLSMTNDQKHIVLKLYHGNWYEDLASSGGTFGSSMYRRETFHDKEILIPYDATFTRMDDGAMRSQYIGKNITELRHSIDSVQTRVDSVGDVIADEFKAIPVLGVPSMRMVYKNDGAQSSYEVVPPVAMKHSVNFDSLYSALTSDEQQMVISGAVSAANSHMQDAQFRTFSMSEDNETLRRHMIEMQKKFTLSLACLIFFFIGAPLGAIIRKGGLGTPIVISVLLFIVYYIIDNTGYKLARDGHWPVWQGLWLSSAVLLPLGIFLTSKAVNDSAVFNPDAYRNFFRRLLGLHQIRRLEIKEVVINEVDTEKAIAMLNQLKHMCSQFLDSYPAKQSYLQYLTHGFDKKRISQLSQAVEEAVDYLSNTHNQLVINKTMDFPFIRQLFTYHVSPIPRLGIVLAVIFPVGALLYIVGVKHQENLKRDIKLVAKVSDQLIAIFNGTDDRHQS